MRLESSQIYISMIYVSVGGFDTVGLVVENTWTCVESYIQEPILRFGHTAIRWKKYMYIFGGWDGVATLADLYAYDLEKKKWSEIKTKGQITPKGRYRHTSVATDRCMYVFGGIDQYQERFNDVIEFNFETSEWTRVVTIGTPPSPRTFHQAVYYNGHIYVMGGFDGWKRNDVYKILIDKSDLSDKPNNE